MQTNIYALRPATEDDCNFLYQLHRVAIRETVEATWGWDEAFQREHFQNRWTPANRQIVVVDNTDVGVLVLKESDSEVFLSLIEILPDYQGWGIGTTLLTNVIASARQRELPVTLHVLKANLKAQRLYERLGFEIAQERDERYVMTKTFDKKSTFA